MIRFFHPQMIAQSANKPGPTIDQMIDFIIAGLAPRGDGGTQIACSVIASDSEAIHLAA